MTFFRKVGLSFKYAGTLYSVSFVVTLAAAVASFLSPISIPTFSLLKILSVPVILFFVKSFQKGDTIYFWMNMGISRKEYYYLPIAVEFVLYVLLVSLAGILANVVG